MKSLGKNGKGSIAVKSWDQQDSCEVPRNSRTSSIAVKSLRRDWGPAG